MKSLAVGALLFLAAGCSSQNPATIVAVAPRATAAMAPTSAPIVVATVATLTPTASPVIVDPPINGTVTNGNVTEKERQFIFSQIEKLKTASPEQDFEAAWAKKDYRFCAIRGVGRYYPGVPDDRVLDLINRYDDFPIEGTGDFFLIPEQAQLQQLANRYAARYNQLLLARLDERKPAAERNNSTSQR